jgi:hypothetical protein
MEAYLTVAHIQIFLQNFFLSLLFLLAPISFIFNFLKQKNSAAFLLAWPLGLIFLSILISILNFTELFTKNVLLGIWLVAWGPEIFSKFSFTRFFGLRLKEWFTSKYFLFIFTLSLIPLYLIWVSPIGGRPLFPQMACDVSLAHLSMPWTYVSNSMSVNTWWLRSPWHPQFVHMLYAGQIQFTHFFNLRGDIIPTFMNFWFFIISCSLFTLINDNSKSSILAFFVLLLFPIVQVSLQMAYLDMALALWIVAVATSTLKWRETKLEFWFYLVILFAATSFVNKHMGASYSLPFVIYSLFLLFKNQDFTPYKKTILIFKSSLCPMILFWIYYGRNLLFSKNPLFPFFKFKENSYYWDQASVDGIKQAITHWQGENKIKNFFTAIIDINLEPSKYSDTGAFWVGPLWAILFFLSISFYFSRKEKYSLKKFWFFFGMSLSLVVIWFFSSPVLRYLVPQIMILVMLFIYILFTAGKSAQIFILGFVISVSLYANKFHSFVRTLKPPNSESEVKIYIRENAGAFKISEYIKGQNTSGVLYVMLDECHRLYYTVPNIGDWFGGAGYHHIIFQTPETLKKYFSSLNVAYFAATMHEFEGNSKGWALPQFKDDHSSEIRLFGEYAKCFEKVEGDFNNLFLLRLRKEDLNCYDSNLPKHPGLSELENHYPTYSIPLWPNGGKD